MEFQQKIRIPETRLHALEGHAEVDGLSDNLLTGLVGGSAASRGKIGAHGTSLHGGRSAHSVHG